MLEFFGNKKIKINKAMSFPLYIEFSNSDHEFHLKWDDDKFLKDFSQFFSQILYQF